MSEMISDRLTRIQYLLGNRIDIDDKIFQWGVDAYREMAMSIPFPTLESTLDAQLFSIGVDTYAYPATARAAKALTAFVNGNPYPMVKKDIRIVERFPATARGVPAIWAPFGSGIIVRPVPDLAYTFRWRFWTLPVITTPTIQNTPLLFPDDWLTIFDHFTAMLGHVALGERDKAQELRTLLHGDPKHPDENPGWIKEKLLRDAAENVVSDYSVNPQVRAYTYK